MKVYVSKKDIEENDLNFIEDNARKLFDKKYGWSSLDFEFKGEVKWKITIIEFASNVTMCLNLKKKTKWQSNLVIVKLVESILT